MKVEFWGAAKTVTGSMHLITHRGHKLLLDCGLFQGRRKEAFERNRNFPHQVTEADAVILSHAHIDHSGNLPTLFRQGYTGRIYATPATRELAIHLLVDSAQIQKSDVKYVNKRRIKNNQTPFEPLYQQADAMKALQRIKSRQYHRTFEPIPHVKCTFHDAGHMLGSAMVDLEFENEDGTKTKLLFSGDIGRPDMPILRDPEFVDGVNYLIMEATYGLRTHPEGSDTKAILLEAVQEVWKNKGKLIIPAFSVGRTQQIVYELNQLAEEGKLPDIKAFVDSPLALNATNRLPLEF